MLFTEVGKMNQKERKFNITAKQKAAIMDWEIYRNDIKTLEWIVKNNK